MANSSKNFNQVPFQSLDLTEVELFNSVQDLFHIFKGLSSSLGNFSQSVPLVANVLAFLVDRGAIVVVKIVQFLGNGGDLLDSVLVSGQVRLEGLVFLDERLELGEGAGSVVLGFEGFFFAGGPALVDL